MGKDETEIVIDRKFKNRYDVIVGSDRERMIYKSKAMEL